MAQVSYDGLSAEQRLMYEKVMLARAVPPFTHLFFGQQGIHPQTTLPLHEGHQIQWRKLAALTAVTTALADGITPEAEDITITSTTGTVFEYGASMVPVKSCLINGEKLRRQPSASRGLRPVQQQRLSDGTRKGCDSLN
jgi:hypothetical protein